MIRPNCMMRGIARELAEKNRKDDADETKLYDVAVDVDWLAELLIDVNTLAGMQAELIDLYRKESELKKQHKAYLHVRDYADRLCEENIAKVAEITAKYSTPVKFLEKPIPDTTPDERKACHAEKCEAKTESGDDKFEMVQDDLIAISSVVACLIDIFNDMKAGQK